MDRGSTSVDITRSRTQWEVELDTTGYKELLPNYS
jgi:hypothetical protein